MKEKLIQLLTFNPGLALTQFPNTRPWGPFLEGPETFSHPESHSKLNSRTL